MDLSNIDFINVSVFFICIMLAVVFFLAWKTIERKPHTLAWALLYVVAACNGVLNALNDLFPNRDLYWVIVNAVSLLTQWLAWEGYRSRAGRKAFNVGIVAWFIGVELLVILFTLVMPHMGLKMVMIPYSGGLVLLAIAWTVFDSGRRLRSAEIATVILCIIYALVQFSSGTVALMQGQTLNQQYLDLYLMINFLLMPAAFTGMGLFTLLIVVDDLGARLRRQARTDQLTGLKNRRGFGASARYFLRRARRQRRPISLVLCDIDFFKEVNDSHGHLMGDQVLTQFANLLAKQIAEPGVVARVGGEEFAMLLPDQDAASASRIAEAVRQAVESNDFDLDGKPIKVTASFGITGIPVSDERLELSFKQADSALYQAKHAGRNRIQAFQAVASHQSQ